MRELEIIAKLQRRFGKVSPSVEIGIGDDAAVVASGGGMRWALTTDALVEGVHFDMSRCTPRQLGYKSLAVNLSDLAAMGALPRHVLVALALPPTVAEEVVDGIFDGIAALAGEHRVSVVGGNITRSPVLAVTITALGELSGPALERGGGRPGDRLMITGDVGSSAIGHQLLASGRTGFDDLERDLVRRHLEPEPRVAAGQALRLIASAGIDISDGLAQDAGHLARASRCGARIELARLPLSPAYHGLTRHLDDPWLPALAGGEDYELLLAVPPERVRTAGHAASAAGVVLHEIGELVQGSGVVVIDEAGAERPAPAGWEHF
jgi:thiamine-monophosphate kinase